MSPKVSSNFAVLEAKNNFLTFCGEIVKADNSWECTAVPEFLNVAFELIDEIYCSPAFWFTQVFSADFLEETHSLIGGKVQNLWIHIINAFYSVIDYQRKAGGRQLVEGLRKTLPVAERMETVLIHWMESQHFTAHCGVDILSSLVAKACLFAQVGNKKKCNKVARNLCKVLDHCCVQAVKERTREGITRDQQEGILACIHCGTFECNTGSEHKVCKGCENALYCSKECQLMHWHVHKVVCNKQKKKKKEEEEKATKSCTCSS